MADRINISLDETAQALWEKLEDDIKNTYEEGGRSAFFRDMLMNLADDKTKLEAKKELLDNRINKLEERAEDLKLQKKGIEEKLEEISVEEDEKILEHDDEEFWNETVEIIMERRSADSPRDVEKRFTRWFDGRLKAYRNKFESISQAKFKEKLLEEAEKRGYSEEVEKLK